MDLAESRFGMGHSVLSQETLTLAASSGCSAYGCEFVALAVDQPALFINAAAPSLAPLSATNPLPIDRMHGYGTHAKKSVANKSSARSSRRFMNNAG